jgi:hypothetical protein
VRVGPGDIISAASVSEQAHSRMMWELYFNEVIVQSELMRNGDIDLSELIERSKKIFEKFDIERLSNEEIKGELREGMLEKYTDYEFPPMDERYFWKRADLKEGDEIIKG